MKTLRIESENPDWFGVWNKDEVETSMKELGLGTGEGEGEWVEYVLDHAFDCRLADEVVGVIARHGGETVSSVTVCLPDGVAKIVAA